MGVIQVESKKQRVNEDYIDVDSAQLESDSSSEEADLPGSHSISILLSDEHVDEMAFQLTQNYIQCCLRARI